MVVAVAASAEGPSAGVSTIFGRCQAFVFHDTDSGSYESLPNPAMQEGGGAGIKAAEIIAGRKADALIARNLGPKAFSVLSTAGVRCFLCGDSSVADAVALLADGKLQEVSSPSTAAHYGIGGGAGRGPGRAW